MLRKGILLLVIAIFSWGCNNALRSNYTSVRLSQPVAEYLADQQLVVHNNQPKLETRQAKIHAPLADSFYHLQYRKLAGTSLILEVTDSIGRIRNLAIPQTKLSAFPVGLSTTTTPIIIAGILTQRDNSSYSDWTDLAAIGFSIVSLGSDLLAFPLIKLAYPNSHYAVPNNFVIKNVNDVVTLDTSDKNKIFTVTAPVNPDVTPYLNADFQKVTFQYAGLHAGYGLFHRSISQPNDPKLTAAPWFALEFNIQPRKDFRWGIHNTWTQSNSFKSNVTSMQIAYVDHNLRSGQLICGVGLGLGMSSRTASPNITETSQSLDFRKLGNDSQVIIEKTFIPNQRYFFTPFSGFIQYENHISKSMGYSLCFRMTQIESHADYLTRKTLKTTEIIAPGITAERTQNIGSIDRESYTAKNMVFQFNVGLNIRITQ